MEQQWRVGSLWDRAVVCSALVSAWDPTDSPLVATAELSCVWSLQEPAISQWQKHKACPPTCFPHNYQCFSWNKRIFHGKACFKILLVSESVLAAEHPLLQGGGTRRCAPFLVWIIVHCS